MIVVSGATARMKFHNLSTLGMVSLSDAMVRQGNGRQLEPLLEQCTSGQPESLQWVHVVAVAKYEGILKAFQAFLFFIQ